MANYACPCVSVTGITRVAPPLSRCGDERWKVVAGNAWKSEMRVGDERIIIRKVTDFRTALALEEGRRIKRLGMHILARRRTRDIKYALCLRIAQADGHYAWTMTHTSDLRDAFDEEKRKGYAQGMNARLEECDFRYRRCIRFPLSPADPIRTRDCYKQNENPLFLETKIPLSSAVFLFESVSIVIPKFLIYHIFIIDLFTDIQQFIDII